MAPVTGCHVAIEISQTDLDDVVAFVFCIRLPKEVEWKDAITVFGCLSKIITDEV
jgi:hypothetical protein